MRVILNMSTNPPVEVVVITLVDKVGREVE